MGILTFVLPFDVLSRNHLVSVSTVLLVSIVSYPGYNVLKFDYFITMPAVHAMDCIFLILISKFVNSDNSSLINTLASGAWAKSNSE